MARKSRKRKTVGDKLKDVDPNFIDAVQSMDVEKLKSKIVELTRYQIETQQAKSEDIDLQRISEQKKVAEEGYRTTLSGIKLKLSYIHEMLQSKGS